MFYQIQKVNTFDKYAYLLYKLTVSDANIIKTSFYLYESMKYTSNTIPHNSKNAN